MTLVTLISPQGNTLWGTLNRGPITLITIRKRFYMVPLIHGPGHAYSRRETLFPWGTLNHGSRYTHIPVGKHFLQGTLNHGHRHLPDREHHPGGVGGGGVWGGGNKKKIGLKGGAI